MIELEDEDQPNIIISSTTLYKYTKNHFNIVTKNSILFKIQQWYLKTKIIQHIVVIEFKYNKIQFVSLYGLDNAKYLYHYGYINNELIIMETNKSIYELYKYHLLLYDNTYTIELYLDVKLNNNETNIILNREKIIRANLDYADQTDFINRCDYVFDS
jgi:hypothetical protein